MSDTLKCPWCAEEIKAEARVCRYCGRSVEDPAATLRALPSYHDPAAPRAHRGRSVVLVGGAVLLGGVLAVAMFSPRTPDSPATAVASEPPTVSQILERCKDDDTAAYAALTGTELSAVQPTLRAAQADCHAAAVRVRSLPGAPGINPKLAAEGLDEAADGFGEIADAAGEVDSAPAKAKRQGHAGMEKVLAGLRRLKAAAPTA